MAVKRPCNNLGVGLLADEATDCLRMTAQNVTATFRSVCSYKRLNSEGETHILLLVRISHTRATPSRPPVTNTSSVGCSASVYTPDK